jgi:outer membrane protein OmpA-like peptidoglycan-associated protein
MTRYQTIRLKPAGILVLVLTSLSMVLWAQTEKIEGMIKARSGATVIVQTRDSRQVIILLTDKTEVGQVQGMLQARRKEMSMAALIPGLEIQAEGTFDSQNQLVAKLVKFKGNDLERAQSIQAGLHETQLQAERNKGELAKQDAELKRQQERLAAQQEKIAANQANIDAAHEKIAANKAMIDAAIARFGQLDDYYILDEVTVYFGNGKVNVDSQYVPQILKLAEKAKTIEAYNIQVVGYASSAGSATLNQQLSEDRAESVTNLLVQQGNIPLMNLLAPGAMGESRQVGNDKTAEGQAQNRRVVVRVLQNKGIAGLQSAR